MAELRFGTGGIHQRLAPSLDHGGAGQHQVGLLAHRQVAAPAGDGAGMAGHRQGLPGEHRQVEAQGAGGHQAAIGRHLIPLLQGDPIPRHQLGRVPFLQLAVAPHPHLLGQGPPQGLQAALRLVLLPEGEQPVDQHHRPDRPAEGRRARGKGQGTGHPEQQGHPMQQLIPQPQDQRTPGGRRQRVGPEPGQAFACLRGAEPLGRGLQGSMKRLAAQ